MASINDFAVGKVSPVNSMILTPILPNLSVQSSNLSLTSALSGAIYMHFKWFEFLRTYKIAISEATVFPHEVGAPTNTF